MIKKMLQKTSIIFFSMNILVFGVVEPRQACGVAQRGGKTRNFDQGKSSIAVAGVLQNIADAVVNLGPVLSGVRAQANPSSALSILGEVIHLTADLQKQSEKDSSSNRIRSLAVPSSAMNKMVGLIIKAAQLPVVTKKSSLWCLRKGVVRSCPEALCQEMMMSRKGKRKILGDFFYALKTQAVVELEREKNLATRSWKEAILPIGGLLLIPLINFLVDLIQDLMNKYIDNLQVDLTSNSLLPADILAQINNVVDGAQSLANVAVDQQQEQLNVKAGEEVDGVQSLPDVAVAQQQEQFNAKDSQEGLS